MHLETYPGLRLNQIQDYSLLHKRLWVRLTVSEEPALNKV